jgi:hypothetical protein
MDQNLQQQRIKSIFPERKHEEDLNYYQKIQDLETRVSKTDLYQISQKAALLEKYDDPQSKISKIRS